MKNLIKLILKTSIKLEISPTAALYLYSRRYKIIFPSNPKDWKILHEKGYLMKGKLDDATSGILTGIEKSIGKRKQIPKKDRPYRFVYDHLREKVLPLNLSNSIQATLDRFLPVEGEIKEYYKVFLHIFPSNSIEKNTKWSQYYGVRYSGYKLRVVSNSSVTNFSKICRSYDPDILLLATHMMVSNSIRKEENRAFVMKISNFMAEWYDRYMEASELLEKKGDRVFSVTDRGISSSNNTILI